MNFKELRFGNWIMPVWSGFTQEYRSKPTLHTEEIVNCRFNPHHYEPVLLSKDILLANGFQLSSNEWFDSYHNNDNFYVSYCKVGHDKIYIKGKWYCSDGGEVEIPNLHWLQNYHFFVYHKELEFKF